MLDGLGPRKKRKFPISKVKESLQWFSGDFIEDQLRLLETHVMVDKPKGGTVQLVENFSLDAIGHLQGNCDFDGNELMGLQEKIQNLTLSISI